MNASSAVPAVSGQLRWVSLRSSVGAAASASASEGGGEVKFAKLLEGRQKEGISDTAAALAKGTLDTDALLWQRLDSGGSVSGAISGVSLGGGAGRPTDYEDLIQAASAKYGVPGDLIKAVIDAESSFNPNVESSAGAKGLMQLMDGTAAGLGVSDPFDPAQNIDGGVKYLSYQLKRFGGQVNMALAAYNAGPGRVLKLGVSTDQELLDQIDRLPKETQDYIAKIERNRQKYADQ
ncbi:transglycosylase SLT domain-containing protein [Paenibacillus spiritus]|uniref:Transglycosylase SLT domain-containing protein n=1 Tax=Paenibacillus spiritus TaxID=2496557 RepID=A0A5J5GHC9_9BACL|nr:lytic transglycosylase domain-containing protein [Paenibacillus spiritus]KAA9007629.1 transglycosylase SLT domain-containing protein [Paenibacillus spiritus]